MFNHLRKIKFVNNTEMKLYIKNMRGVDSKLNVEIIADSLNIYHLAIKLGFIEVRKDLSQYNIELFEIELNKIGLELIINNIDIIAENVKNIIYDLYNSEVEISRATISHILSNTLHYDFNYISSSFKKVNGFSIQSYVIMIKIDKVKKILTYNSLSLKEIAFDLNYSSTAHLSNQFKKTTGLTTSDFRKKIKLGRLSKPFDVIKRLREENTP